MYQVENSSVVIKGHKALVGRSRTRLGIGRTVVLLGVVSLLTDISAEMVTTILPLYLIYAAGVSPLQYGLIDGVYQGGAAVVRIAGGFVGDRWRRHKEVAVAGYGVSALCKLGLIAVGSAWGAITGLIALDRAGKGIRTAPRDAMISLSTPPHRLGAAFGVHRALDTTGALLGPLIAFGLLMAYPGAFDSVFFVSFCFGLIGLGVLILFVQNPDRDVLPTQPTAPRTPMTRLLGERRFMTLTLAAGLLGLTTVSDGFIYLGLQRELDLAWGVFPILFVATAAVYMVFALPVGRLADRVGRTAVFVTGYGLLLAVYACLLLADVGYASIAVAIGLLGLFYAATDGVLAAIASALLPAEARGTGLATLVTATSGGRFAASLVFGAFWTAFGYQTALATFAIALAIALAAVVPLLVRAAPRLADA